MPCDISLLHNLNPHWDWLDATEISLSGVTVRYAGSRHANRWEWFSHAVVGRNVIAFMSVTQTATLVLVSKSMLQIGSSQQTKDDRDSILDVVKKKLGVESKRGGQRRMFGNQSEKARGNRMLQRSRNRQRTTTATTDSLMFAGDVTTDDMNRIPCL